VGKVTRTVSIYILEYLPDLILLRSTKIYLLTTKPYAEMIGMRLTCLLMLAAAGLISIACGHMLYAEFPEDISAPSEVEVWITYGHEDEGLTAPRLSMARAISPDGSSEDLDLKEGEGRLVGAVEVEEAGCYILDLIKEPRLTDMEWFGINGPASLIQEYGRAVMTAGSGRNSDWSSGEGLEIIPAVDPSDLERGDIFEAQVTWQGEPIGGDYSAVVVRTPEDLLTIKHAQDVEVSGSSSEGEAEFELTLPGLWVVTFEATVDESGTWTAESDDENGNYAEGDELDFDQITPTAYLTFWSR
jgi:cobalt/nickel transport protein